MVQSKSNPRVNRFSATSFILYSITFLLLLTTTCYHYYHSYNNQNQTNHITHHHNYIQPKESHSHSNSSSHSDSNSSSHLNSNTATHLNPNTSSHPVTQLHSKLKLKHIFHHSSNTFKQYSLSNSTNDDIHPISSSRHKLADSNTDLNTFEIPYKTQLSNPTLKLPDPTNSDTVLKLAQMTYNAYFEPSREDWRDVEGWNVSTEFGWENDGIRGYVFVDDEKDTLVITIKGTSARWIGGGKFFNLLSL